LTIISGEIFLSNKDIMKNQSDPDQLLNASSATKNRLKLEVDLPDCEVNLTITDNQNTISSSHDINKELACMITTIAKMLLYSRNQVLEYGVMYGLSEKDARNELADVYVERLRNYIPYGIKLYFDQIQSKINEAIYELLLEVIAQVNLDARQHGVYTVVAPEVSFKEILAIGERPKRKRLNILQGGKRTSKHHWSDELYELFLNNWTHVKPIWKHAKHIYKQRFKEKEWIRIVKASCPDFSLPDELVRKLSDPDNYIASPANIALEHAARLSGCENNLYSSKHLKRHLSEAQKRAKRKQQDLDIQANIYHIK
jgi:hypothetical protein